MEYFEINNTKIILEEKKDTPRIAIYLFLKTANDNLFKGAEMIHNALLLQGTKTKSAEDIANILANSGIELNFSVQTDYFRVSIICLKEDIDLALEITEDILLNSTFLDFDKEVFKYKGETISSLDSPVAKARDAFYRELFKDSAIYSWTNARVLEIIDDMKMEDVLEYHKNILYNSRKIISAAGDIENMQEFAKMLSEKLSFMQENDSKVDYTSIYLPTKPNIVKTEKSDAKQAQIFQGWIVPGVDASQCYPNFCILNNVLGASGLSSRLFVELRDKRGLAYTVRSNYKVFIHSAAFIMYIGTNPQNIEKSLEGFRSEIERLIKEPPSEEELTGAIENFIGKFKYSFTQTNAQIANLNGWNYIFNLEFDYQDKLLGKIKKVTKDDIIETAKKYLVGEPVISILAPKEYLNYKP